MKNPIYKMSIDLNILNHLGIKLYSNIPAVLSEVVANSWDADAELVNIHLDTKSDKITITDNGHGMNESDFNEKFLHVGYQRRNKPEEAITPKWKRSVMGRKGIGKLSLFSIADIIEVRSVKGKEKNGFILDAKAIQKIIEENPKAEYRPKPIPRKTITLNNEGTQITLRKLKKNLKHTIPSLKKRIARRFSIIGEQNHFCVKINDQSVTIADRDYFHKLQYIWFFGEESKSFVSLCSADKLEYDEKRSNKVTADGEKYSFGGWIGTVEFSGDLKDQDENLNKIILMTRGKLAQEDILEDYSEGGLYSKYLIGEIHADFLDLDTEPDIATTNRQEIIKEDPRYLELKSTILAELKHIQNKWTALRIEKGTEHALEIPAIKEWYKSVDKKLQGEAKKLLGKINTLKFEDESQRKQVLKQGIIAFEMLKYRQNLKALDKISPDNFQSFGELFSNVDDIEATLYYQIASQRVGIIDAILTKIEKNDKEKVIQEYLFDHLWILDPSWERATVTPLMERRVTAEFKKIDATLTKEEFGGRIDIKYKAVTGKHVIIELKRAGVKVDSIELLNQVKKYRSGLLKLLKFAGKNEPLEVVCILGERPSDWETESAEETSRKALSQYDTRIIFYDELIENSYMSYKKYLEAKAEIGKLQTIISNIDAA
jgi:hypothetical protein